MHLLRRCVIENIKKLAAFGFINVTKRTIQDAEDGRKRNTSNLYHLNTGVVNHIHQGSERDSLGVVNEVHPNQSVFNQSVETNTPHPPLRGCGSCFSLDDLKDKYGMSDERCEALELWVDYREGMENGNKMRPGSIRRLVDRWAAFDDCEFIGSVETCVSQGYKSLHRM